MRGWRRGSRCMSWSRVRAHLAIVQVSRHGSFSISMACAAGWLRGGAHDAWLLDGVHRELEALFQPAAGVPAGAPVLAAEVAAWTARCKAWACLVAAAGDAGGESLNGVMAALEARVGNLYKRPYLPRGDAERTLALLRALFQVSPLASLVWYFIAVC